MKTVVIRVTRAQEKSQALASGDAPQARCGKTCWMPAKPVTRIFARNRNNLADRHIMSEVIRSSRFF